MIVKKPDDRLYRGPHEGTSAGTPSNERPAPPRSTHARWGRRNGLRRQDRWGVADSEHTQGYDSLYGWY